MRIDEIFHIYQLSYYYRDINTLLLLLYRAYNNTLNFIEYIHDRHVKC